jgi:hypothetical protein
MIHDLVDGLLRRVQQRADLLKFREQLGVQKTRLAPALGKRLLAALFQSAYRVAKAVRLSKTVMPLSANLTEPQVALSCSSA